MTLSPEEQAKLEEQGGRCRDCGLSEGDWVADWSESRMSPDCSKFFGVICQQCKDNMGARCPECGVTEGHLHEYPCEVELCPQCGDGAFYCDCFLRKFGIKRHESPQWYDLSEEQLKPWLEVLEAKGRIPFIEYPGVCAKCGKLSPDCVAPDYGWGGGLVVMTVTDEDWKHYIQPDQRDKQICQECFDKIVDWIDNAQDQQEK